MQGGYAYIVGSISGTLYIGVTSDLETRVWQHKQGTFEGFAAKYGCNRLLYYERFDRIETAIAREKQLILIRVTNPEFKDLAEKWGWKLITVHESMKP